MPLDPIATRLGLGGGSPPGAALPTGAEYVLVSLSPVLRSCTCCSWLAEMATSGGPAGGAGGGGGGGGAPSCADSGMAGSGGGGGGCEEAIESTPLSELRLTGASSAACSDGGAVCRPPGGATGRPPMDRRYSDGLMSWFGSARDGNLGGMNGTAGMCLGLAAVSSRVPPEPGSLAADWSPASPGSEAGRLART